MTIENLMERMSRDGRDYRGDSEMHDKRIDLFCSWIHEIGTLLKGLSESLGKREYEALLEVAKSLYEMKYFQFGTPYGTGYGIRPVLEVVRCLRQNQDVLETQELRIEYLQRLQRTYSNTLMQVDPKWHYDLPVEGEDNKLHNEVEELNTRLRQASLDEILAILQEE